jgi:hypothetical protein
MLSAAPGLGNEGGVMLVDTGGLGGIEGYRVEGYKLTLNFQPCNFKLVLKKDLAN